MSAKKKKKKSGNTPKSGYNIFLEELLEALDMMNTNVKISDFTEKEKRTMFTYKPVIKSPKKGNEGVSNDDLKQIDEMVRCSFREKKESSKKEIPVSTHDFMLLMCFTTVRLAVEEEAFKAGEATQEDVDFFKKLDSDHWEAFSLFFTIDYCKALMRMSDITTKYYTFDIDGRVETTTMGPRVIMDVIISAMPAEKEYVNINKIKRPIYKLGNFNSMPRLEWIKFDASLLGNSYRGEQSELLIYIQGHALQRLKERLDVVDSEAINYLIWENTAHLKQIDRYGSYYLIPFRVMEVKVGYLAAKIINDRFVITTFLFITHNSSPEGEKLKQLAGLTKDDISYWKVDRLSAFVNFDEEHYPVLMKLFEEAGMGNLRRLKEQVFDAETLQNSNLDGFAQYVRKNISYMQGLNKENDPTTDFSHINLFPTLPEF